MLETEYDNKGSLALYDSIGFLREKRIHGFYSNLKDACVSRSNQNGLELMFRFRLILPLSSPSNSYQAYHPAPRSDERMSVEPSPPSRPDQSAWDDDMYT